MILAASLEKRIAGLVERHGTHVRFAHDQPVFLLIHSRLQVHAPSELFVAWDDVLAETENKVTKLERDREERQRLGYE
jgi:hypothetical protein